MPLMNARLAKIAAPDRPPEIVATKSGEHNGTPRRSGGTKDRPNVPWQRDGTVPIDKFIWASVSPFLPFSC